MFTIISIMFIGIGIGYLMRNVQMLQKSGEKRLAHHLTAALCTRCIHRFQPSDC